MVPLEFNFYKVYIDDTISSLLTVYMHLSFIAGSGTKYGNVEATNSVSIFKFLASALLSVLSLMSGPAQRTP